MTTSYGIGSYGMGMRMGMYGSSIQVIATTLVWTGGAGDGLWSTPQNWSTGTVPREGDTAHFDGAVDCTVDVDPAVHRIVLLPTYTGKVTFAVASADTEAMSVQGGTADLGLGATQFTELLEVTGGSLEVKGATSVKTFSFTGGAVSMAAAAVLSCTGNVTANGTVTANANSTLLFTGTATQTYTGTATWAKALLNKTGGEVVQASDFRCSGLWTVQAGETTRRWATAGFDLHCGSLLVPNNTRAITLTGATWIRCAGDFDVGSISGGGIFTGTLRLEHGGGICRYAQVDGRITNYVAKANATVIPRTLRVDGTAHFEADVLVTTADGIQGIVRLYGATEVTTGVGVVFQKVGTELLLIYIEGTVSFDFADFNNCQIRVPSNVGYEMQGDLITTDDFVPEGGNQGANSVHTNGHAITCRSIRLGGFGPTAGSWLYIENGSTVACVGIFQSNNGRQTNHINVDATSLLRVRGDITLQDDWGSLNADQVNQPGWLVENLEHYDNANQTVSIETDRRTENVTVNKTGGTLTYSKAHDFDTLICNTPGQALTFQAGATFEVGTLTINGAVGNLVSIDRNGGSGTDQFFFDVAAAQEVSLVSLTNSNISVLSSAVDSVDGGNNTNWNFVSSIALLGDPLTIDGVPVHFDY